MSFARSFVFILTIASGLGASAATYQNNIVPANYKEGYLSAGIETNYLSTSSNYDGSGNTFTLPPGYSFNTIQTTAYSRYDYTNQLSLYAELPTSYATSKDGVNKRTKFLLNGFALGSNYDLGMSFLKVILDLRGYLTAEKWNPNSDVLQTSDGTNKVDIGFHLFKRISQLRAHTFLGYEYRTAGFSGLLNYQADLAYLFKENVMTLGIQGYKTVTHDQYSNDQFLRDSHLVIVNGDSLAIASADPSITNIFGMAKFSASNAIDIYGTISKSLMGQNVSNQMAFMLGFEYFFEPFKHAKKTQTIHVEDDQIDPGYEKDIQDFNTPVDVPPPIRNREKTTEPKNNLQYSRKDWIKKPKPKMTKQKSGKKKRVEIVF